jgi:pyruvate, water dikinase
MHPFDVTGTLTSQRMPSAPAVKNAVPATLIVPFARARRRDVSSLGGKGANLGEMIAAGLPVPPGFVISIAAYQAFYAANDLEVRVTDELAHVDADNPASLERSAKVLQQMIVDAAVPDYLSGAIEQAYESLVKDDHEARVAVRSSATAEDTAQFSFAGMFESFLNVAGKDELIDRVKDCWASTFGARVLFYRIKQDMPLEMPVAVVVQRMIDSEKAGVMFTTDPATQDSSKIVIEAAWGLGEAVVQGAVTPDRHILDKTSPSDVESTISRKEFLLAWDDDKHSTERVDLTGDKRADAPVLTNDELETLGDLAKRAEKHYGVPQDLEFAIEDGKVYLTQSRPITTLAEHAPSTQRGEPISKQTGKTLVRGLGASPGQASGAVRMLESPSEESAMNTGEVLVTHMTSPDWVPIMRRAAAIVTEAGGMTSHAAIVARELGLPCVVGAHDAMHVLAGGAMVTVDGSAGTVSEGRAPQKSEVQEKPAAATTAERGPLTATKVYVNLAEPDRAAEIAQRDVDGVGLLRAEFMMVEALEHMHPRAFLKERSEDEFVERMASSLREFAQPFHPRPIVYRAMDFRSNEFRNLKGGADYEPTEANPMIGYRGCFRYTREPDLFALECRALATVRREFDNLHLMIPFVRTAHELEACLALIDESPLGKDHRLERWIMAEVPSVVYWLPRYAELGISGVSIGSNDLTQLLLGVDRDSELFGADYDERDAAVLNAVECIIRECRRLGLTCSICGQAPSVHAEYAEHLVRWGIDSISVNADAIEGTRHKVAIAERSLMLDHARSASST